MLFGPTIRNEGMELSPSLRIVNVPVAHQWTLVKVISGGVKPVT